MIKEIKEKIIKNGLCSRDAIEKAACDVAIEWESLGKKFDSETETLFTGEVFGYNVLFTIVKDFQSGILNFLFNITPVGKVQRLYEHLICEGYDAIIYYTGNSIYLTSNVERYDDPVFELCEERKFYIEMEKDHPIDKGRGCWKLTPSGI